MLDKLKDLIVKCCFVSGATCSATLILQGFIKLEKTHSGIYIYIYIKAFDYVNHNILLENMKFYGI
jgi:hypothetical protein